uniref:Uncharacterized protein n=1 Tax=Avena sativa TaxID=4498 RepID=A0ACD5YDI0_AVESA
MTSTTAIKFCAFVLQLRFRHEPEYEATTKLHVGKCCNQLLVSVLYYARIQAIQDHAYKTENHRMKDKLAGRRYLEKNEYMAQRPWWCTEVSWEVLVDEWCSSKWIEQSMKNRGNRLTSKYKVHRGGSNSLTTICQKLSEKEGREVSKIEAWMHTHRGADPNKPDVLNSVEASKCLDLYKQNVGNVHGKDYDWLHFPIVPQALYEAGKGKPHGKWSLFNGVVDDRETLREVQISRSSSSSKR